MQVSVPEHIHRAAYHLQNSVWDMDILLLFNFYFLNYYIK